MVDDGPEKNPENNYPDGDHPPEDCHVQVIGLATDLGYAPGHIEFPGCMRTSAPHKQSAEGKA